MRIISGIYKGRKLNRVGKITTRETADMVREAVFQMIEVKQDDIVLDLFAGSGAYGLEAISRGAKFAYLSDHDKDAVKTIYDNAKSLKCEYQVEIMLRDEKQVLKKLAQTKLNIIFIDPPYKYDRYDILLNLLAEMLDNDGYIVVETDKKTELNDQYQSVSRVKEKIYGIKKISIYRK